MHKCIYNCHMLSLFQVENKDPQNPVPYLKTLSRPGSAYVFNENFANDKVDDKVSVQSTYC